MHTITLVMGDPWNDGHGRSRDFTIECNLDPIQLRDAYKAGCEILGFNIEDEIARNYEDNKLEKRFAKRFQELGLDWNWEGDKPITLDTDGYAELWLFAVKLGCKQTFGCDFTYTEVHPHTIEIDGYGLFYA